MTDTKAAIRFLVHNQVYGSLPGDPERVIITGMSGGGALTAVVAASGNSSDYHPSLAEIGALGITEVDGGYVDDPLTGDNVFATFSSAPMIEQDIASEAHEWMYYPTRQKVADGAYADAEGITNGRNNPERLADWQLLASAVLSQGDGYPAYLESLGLKVKDIQRTMLEMVATSLERLLNEGVTYRPELLDVTAISNRAEAEEALKTYLRFAMNNPVPGFEELPLDWFTIAGKPGAFKVVITPKKWASVNEYMYWSAQFVKNPPATDQDGLVSNLGGAPGYSESSLYGGPGRAVQPRQRRRVGARRGELAGAGPHPEHQPGQRRAPGRERRAGEDAVRDRLIGQSEGRGVTRAPALCCGCEPVPPNGSAIVARGSHR